MDPQKTAKWKGSNRSALPDTPKFKGIQFEGYTSAERTALVLGTGDAGLVVYDSDDKALVQWNGTGWSDADASAVAAQPTFTSVTPTGGTTAGGTAFTIVGTNLSGVKTVTIGGAAATSVVGVDDTHITGVSPAGTAGAKSIVITTQDGSVTAASAYTYS